MAWYLSPRGREKLKPSRWLSDRLWLYPVDLREDLRKRLTGRPSSGLMVLDYLIRIVKVKVEVFAFDWFATKSWCYPTRHLGPHEPVKERDYYERELVPLTWPAKALEGSQG